MVENCYLKDLTDKDFLILEEYDKKRHITKEIKESIEKELGEEEIKKCFKIVSESQYMPQDKVGLFPFRCGCNKVHLVIVLPKIIKEENSPFSLQKISDMVYYSIKTDKRAQWFKYFEESNIGYTGKTGEYNLKFFLFLSYIYSLQNLVEKDFRRYYINFEEVLKGKIKGKIKLFSYLNRWISGKKNEIPCRWSEFTYDNWDNRILKCALNYVKNNSGSSLLHYEIINFLKGTGYFVKSHFDEVFDIYPYEIDFSKAKLKNVSRFYRRSLGIAELIIKNSNLPKTFAYSLKPMYIDMDKLFEMFVSGIAKEAFGEEAEFQKGRKLFKENGKEYGPLYKPDIKINNGEKSIIIDAKYKELLENEIDEENIEKEIKNETPRILNADVYQIYFYLQAEGGKTGIIVFPFWNKEKDAAIVCNSRNGSLKPYIFNTLSSEEKKLYFLGLNFSKDVSEIFKKAKDIFKKILKN